MVYSQPFYTKTHYLPDRKSRVKLQKKWVKIPGTGSVFQYRKNVTGCCNDRGRRTLHDDALQTK